MIRSQEPRISQSKLNLRVAKHGNLDHQDVEVVDLAEEFSPIPYSKPAPHDYRKLHKLHASTQKWDTSNNSPKQNPQFNDVSEEAPDLPFLRDAEVEDDIFYVEASEGEELPSPSKIVKFQKEDFDMSIDIDDPFNPINVSYEEAFQSSAVNGSLGTLGAEMLDMDVPVPFRLPTPKVNSSFANGIFDFDAFEEEHGQPDEYSSPLMSASRKRELSRSPPPPDAKHRRLSRVAESNSAVKAKQQDHAQSEVPVVESRRIKIQDLVEPPSVTDHLKNSDSPQPETKQCTQRAFPDWVNEFDADLIKNLMGVVDFVD